MIKKVLRFNYIDKKPVGHKIDGLYSALVGDMAGLELKMEI